MPAPPPIAYATLSAPLSAAPYILGITPSPTTPHLVLRHPSQSLTIADSQTLQPVAALQDGHAGHISSVSCDGGELWSAAVDGSIVRWDERSRQKATAIKGLSDMVALSQSCLSTLTELTQLSLQHSFESPFRSLLSPPLPTTASSLAVQSSFLPRHTFSSGTPVILLHLYTPIRLPIRMISPIFPSCAHPPLFCPLLTTLKSRHRVLCCYQHLQMVL